MSVMNLSADVLPGVAAAVPGAGSAEATFELDLPAHEAFDLFTPEGERRWVPGWSPRFLHRVGVDGELPGSVWITPHPSGRDLVWLTVEADRAAGRLGYVRVADGLQRGSVEVRLVPRGERRTQVWVRYALVGLGDEGRREVDAFLAPAAYAEAIAGWKRRIDAALGL